MILDQKELLMITGGATSVSGTLLNAVAKLISTVLDIGRVIGSAFSMVKNRTKC